MLHQLLVAVHLPAHSFVVHRVHRNAHIYRRLCGGALAAVVLSVSYTLKAYGLSIFPISLMKGHRHIDEERSGSNSSTVYLSLTTSKNYKPVLRPLENNNAQSTQNTLVVLE